MRTLIIAHDQTETTWDPVGGFQHHTVADAEAMLGDDIWFTPCQAEQARRHGIEITDESILPGVGQDPSCDGLSDHTMPQALHATMPRWKENFNQATNKYEVGWFMMPTHAPRSSVANTID